MTDLGCRAWRGALAMRALGRVDPDTDPGLDAHVEGCPACRAELEELTLVADAAALAEPDRIRQPAAPPGLAERVVARVAAEARRERDQRRRQRRVALAAAAVAVVAAVATGGLWLVAGGDDPPVAARVELAGTEGRHAVAELTARPWGTEVALEVDGLDAGERYWLWLTDAGGDRVAAGSVTGTGRPVRAVLAAATDTDEADRVWLTDEDDRVVLDARVGGG